MSFLEQSYWVYQGKKYYRKFELMREARDLGEVEYVFYQGFDNIDCTKEPPESLQTLIYRRARQLRESYDYLRLFYSGGADSHTALRAFIDQGLKVDEIVMYRISPISWFDGVDNIEINAVALPFLQSCKEELRSSKISILDVGYSHFKKFYENENWVEKVNLMSFRPSTSPQMYVMFPELNEVHHRYPRVCDIFGGDKPRLMKLDGRYYWFTWDGSQGHNIGSRTIEEFYITDALPSLHLKQCHIVKNYLKVKYPNMSNLDTFFHPKSVHRDELNSLIRLPLFRNISVGKSPDAMGIKNEFGLECARAKAPDIYEYYQRPIKELVRTSNRLFNQGRPEKDFIGIRSKLRDLGV